MTTIIDKLKKYKTEIEDPATHLHLSMSESQNEMYEFSSNGFALRFNWEGLYAQDIRNANLKVILYEKSGHMNFDYKEIVIKQNELKIDRDLLGNIGWCDYESGKNFLTTEELTDKWVKIFIDGLSKRKRNGR